MAAVGVGACVAACEGAGAVAGRVSTSVCMSAASCSAGTSTTPTSPLTLEGAGVPGRLPTGEGAGDGEAEGEGEGARCSAGEDAVVRSVYFSWPASSACCWMRERAARQRRACGHLGCSGVCQASHKHLLHHALQRVLCRATEELWDGSERDSIALKGRGGREESQGKGALASFGSHAPLSLAWLLILKHV